MKPVLLSVERVTPSAGLAKYRFLAALGMTCAALLLAACGTPGAVGEPTGVKPDTSTPPVATSADTVFVRALRAHLDASTETGSFSGAVLVARDGITLFERAYGLADRERGIPNTTQTRFRVGSMNKMFTAVAALRLVQDGKLKLDTPFATYLADYPNTDMSSKVTLHHLLTHTGGTGDIFGPAFNENRLQLREPKDYLALYGTRGLRFQPGASWEYSNYGFVLAGALIEQASGMKYDEFVASRILAPAGMTATGAAPEDSAVADRAVGYTKQLVPGELVSNAPTLPYRGTPAGGGYSTVGDFARFAAALRQHKLLDASHTSLALTGKVKLSPGDQYGYGFMMRTLFGRVLFGHSGGAPGMNGDLAFELNGGYTVVVLSNLDSPAAAQVMAFILARLP